VLDPSIVERAGLIVVDKGDVVIPDVGSDALLSSLRGDDALVLEFPVEIEVRIVPACDPDAHIAATLERLTQALEGLA
jgi:hypothetical protein